MPKVSVIIPVFGVEKYIERCARSLFEQTLDDIEYLFIDDCTPDRSIEILQQVLDEYPQRKPQVVIHRMEQNSGQAAVRKWGMQNATGEYVIHCDSDDWVDTDMYRAMYMKAVEDDADCVVCDYTVTDGQGKDNSIIACHDKNKEHFILGLLLQKDSWVLWNKLFKRMTYSEGIIYPKENVGEDLALCLQLLQKCNKVSYVSQSLYYYFYNAGSVTQKRDKEGWLKLFMQTKANVDIVISLFSDKSKETSKLRAALNSLKFFTIIKLYGLIHEPEYRRLWLNTYPEDRWMYFFNPNINSKDKFKYALALCGSYPRENGRLV